MACQYQLQHQHQRPRQRQASALLPTAAAGDCNGETATPFTTVTACSPDMNAGSARRSTRPSLRGSACDVSGENTSGGDDSPYAPRRSPDVSKAPDDVLEIACEQLQRAQLNLSGILTRVDGGVPSEATCDAWHIYCNSFRQEAAQAHARVRAVRKPARTKLLTMMFVIETKRNSQLKKKLQAALVHAAVTAKELALARDHSHELGQRLRRRMGAEPRAIVFSTGDSLMEENQALAAKRKVDHRGFDGVPGWIGRSADFGVVALSARDSANVSLSRARRLPSSRRWMHR